LNNDHSTATEPVSYQWTLSIEFRPTSERPLRPNSPVRTRPEAV